MIGKKLLTGHIRCDSQHAAIKITDIYQYKIVFKLIIKNIKQCPNNDYKMIILISS